MAEDEQLTEDEITEEQMEEQRRIQEEYGSLANLLSQTKYNVHTFLNEVLKTKDTTKVGFLSEAELGLPPHPVRAYKEMEIMAREIIGSEAIGNYFALEAEKIALAPSLSRNGKLIHLAVVTKRVVADETKIPKENKGWFKAKGNSSQQENEQ